MDATNEVKGHSAAGILLAFLGGAAAGALAALLLAPGSGAESRRRLAEGARKPKELADRVANAMHEATTAAKKAFGEAAQAEPPRDAGRSAAA